MRQNKRLRKSKRGTSHADNRVRQAWETPTVRSPALAARTWACLAPLVQRPTTPGAGNCPRQPREETIMRVAIYARKSQENEDAITRQITLAREFADRSGFVVVQDFQDDGISGAEFVDRPGLTALVSAVKAHAFEGVITMNVDRFGREAYRTNLVMLEIVESGCRIFTYADGQEVKLDTPIAKQMLSMRNYAAEDFRQQIADKTREKLIAKAKLGHATGARTYGYDLVKVDKHVERRVNPDESAIVKRVFEMASEGVGNIRIVNALAKDHVPAPGRKGWAKSVVNTMLANDLYRGVIVYGKTKSASRGGAA